MNAVVAKRNRVDFEGNVEFEFEAWVRDNKWKKEEDAEGRVEGKDGKFRSVVCTFWLQGKCLIGDTCPYLHRLDRSKMTACKHGPMCKVKNCPLKHVEEAMLQECLYFRQGFCCKGPDCKLKHVKRRPRSAQQRRISMHVLVESSRQEA